MTLFSEVLGWEETPLLFKHRYFRKKNGYVFAAGMVCCLLAQFSFLFVTLVP